MSDKTGVLFQIHVDAGDVTGQMWDGEFRCKEIMSFQDQLRADRIRRELLGENANDADPEAKAQATILAELQVRLTDTPTWWQNGLTHSDTNLLMAVWQGCVKVREDRLAKIQKDGEAAREALRKNKE